MRRQLLAERRLGVGDRLARRGPVPAAGEEGRVTGATAEIADQRGSEDDERERHAEEEDRDERGGRDPDHDLVLERAPADPEHRLKHDREHRRLQAEEERLDDPDPAEGGVDEGERHDRKDARQHEEYAGDQATLGLVQQPADVDGELLRLGAGQQHAVVERVQEPGLADPALLLDQDAVHHRDLPGGAAEGEGRHPRPGAHRLGEGDAVLARGQRRVGDGAVSDLARADHRRLLRKWE